MTIVGVPLRMILALSIDTSSDGEELVAESVLGAIAYPTLTCPASYAYIPLARSLLDNQGAWSTSDQRVGKGSSLYRQRPNRD